MNKVKALIFKGMCEQGDDYIQILKDAAHTSPDLLCTYVFEACDENITSMAMPSIAALICCASKNILKSLRTHIINLLTTFHVKDLLLLTEIIKSKIFGKGLGSTAQKIIRQVMETWTVDDIKQFNKTSPKEFYNLLRLIHPRYTEQRGEEIKRLLK